VTRRDWRFFALQNLIRQVHPTADASIFRQAALALIPLASNPTDVALPWLVAGALRSERFGRLSGVLARIPTRRIGVPSTHTKLSRSKGVGLSPSSPADLLPREACLQAQDNGSRLAMLRVECLAPIWAADSCGDEGVRSIHRTLPFCGSRLSPSTSAFGLLRLVLARFVPVAIGRNTLSIRPDFGCPNQLLRLAAF